MKFEVKSDILQEQEKKTYDLNWNMHFRLLQSYYYIHIYYRLEVHLNLLK